MKNEITKIAKARWQGSLKEGSGHISTQSEALKDQPYGFNTRFEEKPGTNPEELLGAAHASCFTMALSKLLGEEDLEAKKLETNAKVILEQNGDNFDINNIYLSLKAEVPGASKEKVEELAKQAKEGCPMSKVLNANIRLNVETL